MWSCLSLLLLLGTVHGQIWEQDSATYENEVHYSDDVGPGSRAFAQTWTDSNSIYYLYGGIGYQNACTVETMYIYSDMWTRDASGVWTPISQSGPQLGPRAAGLTWYYDNALYLYGGEQTLDSYDDSLGEFTRPTQSGNLYEFKLGTSGWTTVESGQVIYNATHPASRLGSATFSNGALISIFGGMTNDYSTRNDWWMYDLENRQNGWYKEPIWGSTSTNCISGGTLPACVYGASTVMKNGVLYLAGGRVGDTISDTLWNFSSSVGWQNAGTLLSRIYYAGTLLPSGNAIYFFGGKYENASHAGLQTFDTDTGAIFYSDQSSFFPARYAAQVWANKIYGGIALSNGSAQIYSDMAQFNTLNNWQAFTKTGWKQLPSTAASTAQPGARTSAMTWVDKTGDLWLYGGIPAYTCGDGKILTDLWHYSLANATWYVVDQYGLVRGANAATWIDDTGNLWFLGGDSSTTPGLHNLVCNMYEWVNPAGGWVPKGCPPLTERIRAITWTYSGLLYLWGGVDASGVILDDLNVFDPASGGTSWTPLGSFPLEGSPLNMVTWSTQYSVYAYTQNQTLYQWDKTSNSGWQQMMNLGPYKPSYRTNAISWFDDSNLYLTRGADDPNDLIVWFYSLPQAFWTSVNVSSPPGPLGYNQYAIPVWNAGWVYVWASETGSPFLSLWLIDPCYYGANYCSSGHTCVHDAFVRCWPTYDFNSLVQFQFINSTGDTSGKIYMDTGVCNYVSTACGLPHFA